MMLGLVISRIVGEFSVGPVEVTDNDVTLRAALPRLIALRTQVFELISSFEGTSVLVTGNGIANCTVFGARGGSPFALRRTPEGLGDAAAAWSRCCG